MHGVADLDRPFELPLEAAQESVGGRRLTASGQAVLHAEAEEPVRDPLAEDRGLHVLGVGVQHVVVAAEPGEDDDVRLGDGPAGRGELLAELEIFEAYALGGIHGWEEYHGAGRVINL